MLIFFYFQTNTLSYSFNISGYVTRKDEAVYNIAFSKFRKLITFSYTIGKIKIIIREQNQGTYGIQASTGECQKLLNKMQKLCLYLHNSRKTPLSLNS